MVMKILAIDLGKYKSVACSYVTATGTARFATVLTHVLELDRLLRRESPDLVVIETCSIAGWVHDLCCQRGVKCQVANPSSEAWKWKNVKRKSNARFPEIKLGLFDAPLFGRPLESNLGFAGQLSPYVVVMLPFWFLVLVSGSLAMLLQLRWPWRFNLRSLFIATTLLAVVLGMIVWLDRAWIGK
jgi:hypothetical protein